MREKENATLYFSFLEKHALLDFASVSWMTIILSPHTVLQVFEKLWIYLGHSPISYLRGMSSISL